MSTARLRRLFEAELARRNVPFAPTLDGRYTIGGGTNGELTVSLDNLARDSQRDGDEGAVTRFVERIVRMRRAPTWAEAIDHIYWSAERFDHDFGDTLRQTVTDTVTRILVVSDPEHGLITWLTPTHLRDWGVAEDDLHLAADRNLDRLLAGIRPGVTVIHDCKLGVVPVDGPFKASVIFAPGFKELVEQDIGWPALAVIPCRDFMYILAEKERSLLDYMGEVVQREFRESGYPITTEILCISDDGIEAIGRFQE